MGREVTASSSARCSHASEPMVRFVLSPRNLAARSDERATELRLACLCSAGVLLLRAFHVGAMRCVSGFLSVPCCLTITGADSHRQAALAARLLLSIIRLAAKSPSRRLPLSSNVRRHKEHSCAHALPSCSLLSLR